MIMLNIILGVRACNTHSCSVRAENDFDEYFPFDRNANSLIQNCIWIIVTRDGPRNAINSFVGGKADLPAMRRRRSFRLGERGSHRADILMTLENISLYFSSTRHLLFNLSMSLSLWLGFFIFQLFNCPINFLSHLGPLNSPKFSIHFIVIIELVRLIIQPWTLSIRLFNFWAFNFNFIKKFYNKLNYYFTFFYDCSKYIINFRNFSYQLFKHMFFQFY